MSKKILVMLLLFFPFRAIQSQEVTYVKLPDLEKILNNNDDRLFIINFWATWCPPCVKEIPYFEKVSKEFSDKKVEFLLISLDFPSQIEKQLIPFLKKNKITIPVAAMMETDANLWIEKVDPHWQGDIPATLFLNNAKKIRKFMTGMLEENELRSVINSYL